jgi:hypothetical protein
MNNKAQADKELKAEGLSLEALGMPQEVKEGDKPFYHLCGIRAVQKGLQMKLSAKLIKISKVDWHKAKGSYVKGFDKVVILHDPTKKPARKKAATKVEA